MDLMFQPLRRYADFQGRARRSEFWLYVLFNVLLFIGFYIAIVVAAVVSPTPSGTPGPLALAIGGVGALVYLGLIIPGLAVRVRRLHDINRTGWWVFIVAVPLIGPFIMIAFDCIEGTRGPNRFGLDPKAPSTAEVFS